MNSKCLTDFRLPVESFFFAGEKFHNELGNDFRNFACNSESIWQWKNLSLSYGKNRASILKGKGRTFDLLGRSAKSK